MKTLILTLFSAVLVFAHPEEECGQDPGAAWPLGTIIFEGSPDPATPTDFVSYPFTVLHADLANETTGWLAIRDISDPVGTIVLFTGGGGSTYWTDQDPAMPAVADQLTGLGYRLVMVKWHNGWWKANVSINEDAGVAHLAARPATVVKYLYDTYGQRLIVTGNSGGSGQTAYCLSHYGLDFAIAKAIMTGGPPFSALAKSCGGDPAYRLNSGKRVQIDGAFGFENYTGPCYAENGDAVQIARWNEESVSGGNDFTHPQTSIVFVQGGNDPLMQTVAGDYTAQLTDAGTTFEWQVIPSTPHLVYYTQQGCDAVFAELISP